MHGLGALLVLGLLFATLIANNALVGMAHWFASTVGRLQGLRAEGAMVPKASTNFERAAGSTAPHERDEPA